MTFFKQWLSRVISVQSTGERERERERERDVLVIFIDHGRISRR